MSGQAPTSTNYFAVNSFTSVQTISLDCIAETASLAQTRPIWNQNHAEESVSCKRLLTDQQCRRGQKNRAVALQDLISYPMNMCLDYERKLECPERTRVNTGETCSPQKGTRLDSNSGLLLAKRQQCDLWFHLNVHFHIFHSLP